MKNYQKSTKNHPNQNNPSFLLTNSNKQTNPPNTQTSLKSLPN